jgi:hypothetical protein
MDRPGFVICKVSTPEKELFLRETILPEKIIVDLEKAIIKKYGAQGEKVLYTAGKRAGWRYSLVSEFFQLPKTSSEKKFNEFLYLFVRYVGATWAKKISYQADLKKKKIEFEMDNFIICRFNGLGHFMVEGNTAGFWAYLMDDASIEGFQSECQGKGGSTCRMVYAPPKQLPEKKPYFGGNNFSGLELSPDYEKFNAVHPLQYGKRAILDLINSRDFSYKQGIIEHKGERFFNLGASYFYLLELELSKLEKNNQTLFQTAFNFGFDLIDRKQSNQTVSDLVSALGWGDAAIMKKGNKFEVVTNFFPWTKFAPKINFALYRGMISGLLSKIKGRKVRFSKHQTTLKETGMVLQIKE